MTIIGSILWIVVGLSVGGIIYLIADALDFQFDREIKVALTAGIIGSLFFSFFFAPVLVPAAYHLMAATPAVDAPYPGIEMGFNDDVPAYAGDFNETQDLDYYQLLIWNPHQRPVSDLSIAIDVPGCIDDTGVRTFVGTQNTETDEYAWAPPGIVEFSQTFEKQGEVTRCDTGVYFRTLPPERKLIVYFIVDTNPEEQLRADFSGADLEQGQMYVRPSFMWQFNSIRKFEHTDGQVLPHNSSTD